MSQLARCHDCEGVVSREAYSCPHCGRRFRETPTQFLVSLFMWGGLVFIVAPIVLLLLATVVVLVARWLG